MKICLKVKFSYICEGGVIYCGNCVHALTNLENVYWACNAQLDYLKPVKPYK